MLSLPDVALGAVRLDVAARRTTSAPSASSTGPLLGRHRLGDHDDAAVTTDGAHDGQPDAGIPRAAPLRVAPGPEAAVLCVLDHRERGAVLHASRPARSTRASQPPPRTRQGRRSVSRTRGVLPMVARISPRIMTRRSSAYRSARHHGITVAESPPAARPGATRRSHRIGSATGRSSSICAENLSRVVVRTTRERSWHTRCTRSVGDGRGGVRRAMAGGC